MIVTEVQAAERNALAADRDKLIERSVGAMAIADGDHGWEKVPLDCPMLEAVAALRRLLDNTRIDVAHRSNMSAGLQMRAEQAECRIRDLEVENAALVARCAGLVYHLPMAVRISAVLAARKAWVDLQTKAGALEAAAKDVLKTYMPQFSDSRAVDDCLVALAAAVAGEKTAETPFDVRAANEQLCADEGRHIFPRIPVKECMRCHAQFAAKPLEPIL
jgi:hypothetical protein